MDRHSEHKDTVSRYFSTKANFWTVVYTREGGACSDFMGHHMRRRRDAVLGCMQKHLRQKGEVLDVGCGSGALLVDIAKQGHCVSGVDISPGMVAEAQKSIARVGISRGQIKLADIDNLPFPDGSFDLITCVGVIEYVCDEKKALSELRRVMKADGRIILTAPNFFKLQNLADPYYWVACVKKQFIRNGPKGVNPIDGINQISTNSNSTNRRYSWHKLIKVLGDCQLAPVDWVCLGYGPFTIGKKKFLEEATYIRISDNLEKFFAMNFRKTGRYFANRWVVCLEQRGV